ncbi:SPOR domain-containing protein [Halopseudomonas phragmitis]|uniref:SPOR domain-containing protein n=1 Tax=Halopseudomonas phragmitis TaxID=1931241 RepID=A0A1V0B1X2_9GAMM|nr:SPOR domain-containing protein [Halopseudomonas phragmitis]AQZ93880.1 hypothetical protein BVH74_03520 [Halopseudomonas phragmitis]
MRSLFLFLLLLNILYGLWQFQDGRASQVLRQVADAALEGGLPGRDAAQSSVDAPLVSGRVEERTTLCVNLGQFESSADAGQLRQRLLALNIQAYVIRRDVPDSVDYWLLMSVPGGREAQMQRLARLQEQGVDSFIVTQGVHAGQLSLGVFSREDYARARQSQLRAQGYDVRVESVEKLGRLYVVQVDSAARRLVDQAMLARLRNDFPGLQHQFHPCRPIANGSNIP